MSMSINHDPNVENVPLLYSGVGGGIKEYGYSLFFFLFFFSFFSLFFFGVERKEREEWMEREKGRKRWKREENSQIFRENKRKEKSSFREFKKRGTVVKKGKENYKYKKKNRREREKKRSKNEKMEEKGGETRD